MCKHANVQLDYSKTAESLLMRFLSVMARPPDLRNEHVDTINLCIYMFLHRMRNRHPLPQAAAIIREAVFEQKEDLLRNAIQVTT